METAFTISYYAAFVVLTLAFSALFYNLSKFFLVWQPSKAHHALLSAMSFIVVLLSWIIIIMLQT